MFEALSQCAALHPDQDDENDEEFDEAFLDANEVDMDAFGTHEQSELSEIGRVRNDLSGNARYAPY
jgi:chloride channel, nucleotide-sensitive, 1A